MDKVAKVDAVICLLTDGMDRGVIEKCYSVRAICDVSVGYNNVDIAAARERQIWVTHTPDVLTDATANLTWALILGATRRVAEGDRLIRKRRLDRLPLRLPARQRSGRQAARHHRHGPHRPGRRPPRAGLRHGGRLRAERAQAEAADVAVRGRAAGDADAVRRADADVRRDLAALPADAGDAPPDRHAGAVADEADGVSGQRRARAGRRRSGAGQGAARAADRRRRARRVRERADRARRSARPRERRCCCRTSAARPSRRGPRWRSSPSTTAWPCCRAAVRRRRCPS